MTRNRERAISQIEINRIVQIVDQRRKIEGCDVTRKSQNELIVKAFPDFDLHRWIDLALSPEVLNNSSEFVFRPTAHHDCFVIIQVWRKCREAGVWLFEL